MDPALPQSIDQIILAANPAVLPLAGTCGWNARCRLHHQKCYPAGGIASRELLPPAACLDHSALATWGGATNTKMTHAARAELAEAVRRRFRSATGKQKRRILDEFVATTG